MRVACEIKVAMADPADRLQAGKGHHQIACAQGLDVLFAERGCDARAGGKACNSSRNDIVVDEDVARWPGDVLLSGRRGKDEVEGDIAERTGDRCATAAGRQVERADAATQYHFVAGLEVGEIEGEA